MAGYSGTPLVRKLGIKGGNRAHFHDAPGNVDEILGDLPDDLVILERAKEPLDFVLLFSKREADLTIAFSRLAAKLSKKGMLWVAWPKQTSGVATDLKESVVRRVGLDAGLVDVKICAIDETWSGLKFMYRLVDR
jgi:hypothetical protein